jgi:transposase
MRRRHAKYDSRVDPGEQIFRIRIGDASIARLHARRPSRKGQLFYEFHLGDAVPEDHLVRKIDAALDLSCLRSELAPHYSSTGRPSIDLELMIRMLVVGYVFAIRSERLICREVQVNLAYP